jgi:hypothetical protein
MNSLYHGVVVPKSTMLNLNVAIIIPEIFKYFLLSSYRCYYGLHLYAWMQFYFTHNIFYPISRNQSCLSKTYFFCYLYIPLYHKQTCCVVLCMFLELKIELILYIYYIQTLLWFIQSIFGFYFIFQLLHSCPF